MFYFDGERWLSFEKKVTYTETVTDFDNDISRFSDKENLTIEENILTVEELSRLEKIKNVVTLTQSEVTEYVKDGIMNAKEDFIKSKVLAEEKEAIKQAINIDAVTTEDLLKMPTLTRKYDPKGYYLAGDVLTHKGGLYVVKIDHPADKAKPPESSPDLYTERIASVPEVFENVEAVTNHPPYSPDENYMKGAKITFNGLDYSSAKDNVMKSPAEDPTAWKVI